MKANLKNPLISRLLIVIVVIILLFLLFLIATTFKTKSYKVEDDIEEVFIGDSHVRYAVDDSLLKNSLSLANSSESVYFSYFKIKQILQSNPTIKTVYLGFSYHNISGYYDQYINGRYSHNVSPNYFYLLPIKQKSKMIKWNLKRLPFFTTSILRAGIKSWLSKIFFQGGFDNDYSNVSAQIESMDGRLNFQYFTNGELNSFSTLNLTYIRNIIKLCNNQKVKLIILNTPLHHYYKKNVPREYVNKYDSLILSQSLKVMDLSDISLPDSCFQPEGDLLSKDGALETTKEIIRRKQHLTNKAHK